MKKFTDLDFLTKMKYLETLHRFINKELFGGKLNEVFIRIENIHDLEKDYPDAMAAFVRNMYGIVEKNGELSAEFKETILFQSEVWLVDSDIFYGNTEDEIAEEQHSEAFITMLHEMIHQYCYENGIDDSNHNKAFKDAAMEHGLDSYIAYNADGIRVLPELIEEYAEPAYYDWLDNWEEKIK